MATSRRKLVILVAAFALLCNGCAGLPRKKLRTKRSPQLGNEGLFGGFGSFHGGSHVPGLPHDIYSGQENAYLGGQGHGLYGASLQGEQNLNGILSGLQGIPQPNLQNDFYGASGTAQLREQGDLNLVGRSQGLGGFGFGQVMGMNHIPRTPLGVLLHLLNIPHIPGIVDQEQGSTPRQFPQDNLLLSLLGVPEPLHPILEGMLAPQQPTLLQLILLGLATGTIHLPGQPGGPPAGGPPGLGGLLPGLHIPGLEGPPAGGPPGLGGLLPGLHIPGLEGPPAGGPPGLGGLLPGLHIPGLGGPPAGGPPGLGGLLPPGLGGPPAGGPPGLGGLLPPGLGGPPAGPPGLHLPELHLPGLPGGGGGAGHGLLGGILGGGAGAGHRSTASVVVEAAGPGPGTRNNEGLFGFNNNLFGSSYPQPGHYSNFLRAQPGSFSGNPYIFPEVPKMPNSSSGREGNLLRLIKGQQFSDSLSQSRPTPEKPTGFPLPLPFLSNLGLGKDNIPSAQQLYGPMIKNSNNNNGNDGKNSNNSVNNNNSNSNNNNNNNGGAGTGTGARGNTN